MNRPRLSTSHSIGTSGMPMSSGCTSASHTPCATPSMTKFNPMAAMNRMIGSWFTSGRSTIRSMAMAIMIITSRVTARARHSIASSRKKHTTARPEQDPRRPVRSTRPDGEHQEGELDDEHRPPHRLAAVEQDGQEHHRNRGEHHRGAPVPDGLVEHGGEPAQPVDRGGEPREDEREPAGPAPETRSDLQHDHEGQGREQHEGALREVEDLGRLEDQHEAERDQRVHDAGQQPADQHFEEKQEFFNHLRIRPIPGHPFPVLIPARDRRGSRPGRCAPRQGSPRRSSRRGREPPRGSRCP